MTDTRYVREPGTRAPRWDQAQSVWAWVAALRRTYPGRADVEGAYHAAEWTLGLTDVPPISGMILYTASTLVDLPFTPPDVYRQVRQATPELIVKELNAAADIAGRPGITDREMADRDRAGGAYLWLSWWTGTGPLADLLVPDADHLPGIPRQAGAA